MNRAMERFNKLPWIEKHRPRKIEHILLDPYVYNKIRQIIRQKDIPNTIITGRPGIGKTTTVRCVGNKLYGKYAKEYVLEFNASDDRGIKIEKRISNFCKSATSMKPEEYRQYPTHKLIIFDEADSMTPKAQNVIGKLMDKFSSRARFVFTCNDAHNIKEIIQSNCNILGYKRVDTKLITLRLQDICDYEKVKYDISGVNYVADICEGDMRSALNILELASTKHKFISENTVADVYDRPHRKVLRDLMKKCIKKDISSAFKMIEDLKHDGYNGSDIMSGMFGTIKSSYCDDFEKNDRVKLCSKISDGIYHISKGLDTDIQILSCISDMCNL